MFSSNFHFLSSIQIYKPLANVFTENTSHCYTLISKKKILPKTYYKYFVLNIKCVLREWGLILCNYALISITTLYNNMKYYNVRPRDIFGSNLILYSTINNRGLLVNKNKNI